MINKLLLKLGSFLIFIALASIPGFWMGWKAKTTQEIMFKPVSCIQSISNWFGGNK